MKRSLILLHLAIGISLSVFGQNDPTANFAVLNNPVCVGWNVNFIDQSYDSISSRLWLFQGGTPDSSVDINPMVTYAMPGNYEVTLIVWNAHGSDTLTIPGFITVLPGPYAEAGNAQTICRGDSLTLEAGGQSGGTYSLETTFASGNAHRGNMFDLTAINDVQILSFEGHLDGNTDMAIYYKTGTHVGYETTPSAWTLLGTAAGVVAQPTGSPTVIPIPVNITIPANQTCAWYVTSTNTSVSLNYTNGTAVGNVYAQDANLQIKEGTGQEYPFGNTIFSPRIWNGIVHYSTGAQVQYLWSTGATTKTIHVAPLETTTFYLSVMDTLGCSSTDSVKVTVNPLPDPVITQYLNQLSTQNIFVSYQWFLNGNMIIGANAFTYNPISTGNYMVRVANSSGCVGNSLPYNYSGVGSEELPGSVPPSIFPSPAKNTFYIQFHNPFPGICHIRVLTKLGQPVFEQDFAISTGDPLLQIDCSGLSRGFYFVELKQPESHYLLKLIRD